jgi:hypothetical protein
MCRMHHKRCYYVDAQPMSVLSRLFLLSAQANLSLPAPLSANSAEDELVAAREEIDRLQNLVRLLMQGGGGSNVVSSPSSSSSSPSVSASSSASSTFPVLSSPSTFTSSPSTFNSPAVSHQHGDYTVPSLNSIPTPPQPSHNIAPSSTDGLLPPSRSSSHPVYDIPVLPTPLAASTSPDLPIPPSYLFSFDPTIFLGP